MKKLLLLTLTLLLVASCACFFGACGEDDIDAKLYHLTITHSSNVTIEQDKLKATYAYGCNGTTVTEGVREQDEIHALKKAGATEDDIIKAGKRQADGSYYFFESDPMYIEAPEVEGFRFLGFYDKATNKLAYRPIITDIDGKRGLARWNMTQGDVELEARYEVLKYSISYCDMNGLITNPTNPTEYNSSEKVNVELNDPAKIEGYKFKYWYYVEILFDGTDNPPTRKVECTKLPNIGNEGIIHTIGQDSAGNPTYGLTLWAEYEKETYNVTIKFADATKNGNVTVNNTTTGKPASLIGQYESGTVLDIWVTEITTEGYDFDKFVIGTTTLSTSNRINYTVTEDVTIEIKVGIHYSINIYLEVAGGTIKINNKYYRIVDENELPPAFKPIRFTNGQDGNKIDVSTQANLGLQLAEQIGDQDVDYKLDTEESVLSVTLDHNKTEYENSLIIVYSKKPV